MKIRISIVILLSMLLGQAVALPQPTMPRAEIRQMADAIAAIHRYYIKPVDNKKLFRDAIQGMLLSLDPHSSFLDEQDLGSLKTMTDGGFSGIGVHILPIGGVLEVISPIDDTPAQKAGIKTGDLIFRINNSLVRDITTEQALNIMRGKKGTKVTLHILRKKTAKPLKFVISRDIIKLNTVKEKLYAKHYGYIRISFFNVPTAKELKVAIKKLQQQSNNGLKGVVLDLRNNPGGMLLAAVEATDYFLDVRRLKNKLIVYTKGDPKSKREDFIATSGELLPNIPIVVLINEGSASAAEIMAGALQDHKRAVILGTKSFGKGSVQSIIPIGKKSAIKLTTALYYTPKDREIQARGIAPDIVIANTKIPKVDNDEQLFEPIYEEYLKNHLLNGNKKDKQNDAVSIEVKYSDYQLYEALNLLQGLAVLVKK